MSSGSPTRSGLLQNLSRISVNTPGTPLWHTASPLAPWQQILSIPSTTQHATHTPSNFTPLNSSTSGIFQYNSVPPAPKIRTRKRLNNENPDTPTPKRARKTAAGTAPRSNPLSTITASAINGNSGDNSNDPLGNNSETLTDTENNKLIRFFTFLQEDLEWSYGELLYYTTIGKSPGAIKDKTGKSTNTKVVQRNAAIIQHFMKGNGKYGPSQILENWLKHPYGAHDYKSELMYSTSEPYINIKPVRPALTSFAVQLVEKQLVKEAESALKPSSGLHISLSNKKTVASIKWPDIGAATVENARKIIQEHQPLTWSFIMKISTRRPRTRNEENIIRQRRPPEMVILFLPFIGCYSHMVI